MKKENFVIVDLGKCIEVIRCQNCKYADENYDTDNCETYYVCHRWAAEVDGDGFCYRGERR